MKYILTLAILLWSCVGDQYPDPPYKIDTISITDYCVAENPNTKDSYDFIYSISKPYSENHVENIIELCKQNHGFNCNSKYLNVYAVKCIADNTEWYSSKGSYEIVLSYSHIDYKVVWVVYNWNNNMSQVLYVEADTGKILCENTIGVTQ